MKEMVIKFEHPQHSVFDECEMAIMVKSSGVDRYDVEMYIMRNRPDSYRALRVNEVRLASASTVDSILDTWIAKLMNRGWRQKLCANQ